MNLRRYFVWMIFALALINTPVSEASIGYIADLSGEVKIINSSGSQTQARKDDTLDAGLIVETGDKSYAVLKFEDGHFIALQSNSSFLIQQYDFKQSQVTNSSIIFSLLKGGLRSITGLIGEANRGAFRLSTPVATIGIRGTDFLAALHYDSHLPVNLGVDIAEPSHLYCRVNSGAISITNDAGTAIVVAGQAALVPSLTERPGLIDPAALPKGIFGNIEQISSSNPSSKPNKAGKSDKPEKIDQAEKSNRPERSSRVPDRPDLYGRPIR